MAEGVVLGGGCHCGYVRYEIRSLATKAFYCHCRICQRLTGSPAMTLAQVAISDFSYVCGEPGVYRSSEHGERRFCPRCGSQLEYRRRPHPETVEFSIGTLDEPARVVPMAHIFTESRIPWFETADALPRRRQLAE
jgi:hypothetical protein